VPLLQPGTINEWEPHIGTVVCLNVVVPQTGKAVEGVWPGAVQGWPASIETIKTKDRVIANDFINSVAG